MSYTGEQSNRGVTRRHLLGGGALAVTGMILPGPLLAKSIASALDGGGVRKLLGQASDSALDKLSQPGAFYADTAIRILLPGKMGKTVSGLMGKASKLGVGDKLVRTLNDAAGQAAKEAKPLFRSAVDGLSIKDVPGLVTKKDGGTQYLKQSAGPDLRAKVHPLINSALTSTGAFGQLAKLGKSAKLLGVVGLTPEGLTDSVTDQALSGIYSYMAREEAQLRDNPLDLGKSLLNGIL